MNADGLFAVQTQGNTHIHTCCVFVPHISNRYFAACNSMMCAYENKKIAMTECGGWWTQRRHWWPGLLSLGLFEQTNTPFEFILIFRQFVYKYGWFPECILNYSGGGGER